MTAHENPLGLDGFEFVEFTSPDPEALADLFEKLGFVHLGNHVSKHVRRYAQGDINFILNMEPAGQAAEFRHAHGPSANGMAFRVGDAKQAFAMALERGATRVETPRGPGEIDIPAIEGIGGSYLYLVDRYGAEQIYDVDFAPVPGATRDARSVGLHTLDHLTHNVNRGRMDHWAQFYERIFNFRQIRYFDIEGKLTGLHSRAMTSPDGKIRIPINEDAGETGQIEEYLQEYKGEGIQHVALGSHDLYESIEALIEAELEFMPAPNEIYYSRVDKRLPSHEEPMERLRKNGILIDGEGVVEGGFTKVLLQRFGKTAIGPIFFEYIQRKGDDGFGEGNFKALFESIEEDQIRRGVIGPKVA